MGLMLAFLGNCVARSLSISDPFTMVKDSLAITFVLDIDEFMYDIILSEEERVRHGGTAQGYPDAYSMGYKALHSLFFLYMVIIYVHARYNTQAFDFNMQTTGDLHN